MKDPLTLRLSIDAGVAHVELIGEKGHAIGADFGREFRAVAIHLEGSRDVRSILLTANGRNFCVGGNLAEFLGAEDLPSSVRHMMADYHAGLAVLLRVNPPIVTAVQGAIAGAGVALAALGDIVYAARSAHFTLAYAGVGLCPDGGSTFILPRLIGTRRFQELALTNRRVEAAEAAEIGLVTSVVEDDTLAQTARETARLLATGPTAAFGVTRSLLLESFASTFERQVEREAQSLAELCRGSDVREGLRAFAQKRRPAFTGR